MVLVKFLNLLKLLFKNIKYYIKKWFIYQRAYSGNFLWPLALILRRYKLKTISLVAAQFLTSGYILDIGTGPGLFPIEMAKNCPNVRIMGIDIESELLIDGARRAKKNGVDERVSFLKASAECLPFLDNTFDMVISTMSFHQWKNRQTGVNEMRRVLKPGGQAMVLVGKIYLLNYIRYFFDFLTRKSHKIMRKYFETAGFKGIIVKNDSDGLLRTTGIK